MQSTQTKTLSERSFGLVVGAVLVFWACGPVLWGRSMRPWLLIPAAIFLLLGAAFPPALVWPKRIWMGITTPVGAAVQFLLMAVLYGLVIAPVGVYFRLIKRDTLKRRRDPKSTSYWIRRENFGDMKQQF